MSVGPLYPGAQQGTPGLVHLVFRIQAGAADGTDPDFIYPSGAPVVSGKAEATGLYTITLATAYPGFLGGTCTVLSAAATALKWAIIDIADYNATTGVLSVQVVTNDDAGGDGTVVAKYLVDNDWLMFDLYFVTAASDAVTGALAAMT